MKSSDAELIVAHGQQARIALNNIIPDVGGLRDVDKKNEDWQNLLSSVRSIGVQEPIQVRRNPEAQEPTDPEFIIINGLHRWTACKEILDERNAELDAAGQPLIAASTVEIPAVILEVHSAEEVYTLQLHTNIQNVKTRPLQILHHCLSIMAAREEASDPISQSELAEILGKSESYVSNILKLKNVSDEHRKLIAEGRIKAAQAYSLGKLPPEEHEDWIERAQTMPATEFEEAVRARVQEIKKNAKRDAPPKDEFRPSAKFVGKSKGLEMMDLWHKEHLADEDVETLGERVNYDSLDFRAGVYCGFQLLFELDGDTLEAKKAKHQAEVRERNRKKAEEDAAKDAKTAAERGVNILVPKGHRAPIGFGSSMKDTEEKASTEESTTEALPV
jgi:ParB-like chromosome segregation protein Spo0J